MLEQAETDLARLVAGQIQFVVESARHDGGLVQAYAHTAARGYRLVEQLAFNLLIHGSAVIADRDHNHVVISAVPRPA